MLAIALHPIPRRPGHLVIEVATATGPVRIGTALLNPSGRYTCRFDRNYFRKLPTREHVLDDDALRAVCAAHCTLFTKNTVSV